MKTKTIKTLSVSLLAVAALIGCNNSNKLTPKLQVVKDNFTKTILAATNTKDYETKSADEIMKNISIKKINGYDTYYFNDVDYVSCQERASFPAGTHLNRTKQIASLAKKTNNSKLMNIAIKLTQHWVLSNYRSVNWWHNEIGCNGNLTDIGIILFDKLDPFIQAAFRSKVDESSIYHRPQLLTHLGSNLINYLVMSLKNSVIDNNEKEFDMVKNKTPDTMKHSLRSQEGFMKDGSYHQHGTEMQTGAYGLEAVGNIGKIIVNTEGTDFTVTDESLGVISKFVTEGISGITHKGKFNYMGMNRAYTRPDAGIATKGTGYKELKSFQRFTNMPNKTEYDNTLKLIDESKPNFEGVKVFPDSNFIAMNIDGVYISFMSANANGRVTESTNGENQLGYNLAWGNNTCVMESGNEYFNISPVWDYSKLPGCTSVNFKKNEQTTQAEADANLRNYTTEIGNSQYAVRLPFKSPVDRTTPCVYNFSEDFSSGVAYSMCQSYKDVITDESGAPKFNSGNAFTITCFATNDGMVLVGSGFTIGTENKTCLEKYSDGQLHTTVEQNIVNDGVTPSKSDDKTVTNGNVIYKALGSNDTLSLDVKEQKGTFQRNNPDGASSVTSEQSHQVMTIGYNTDTAASDKTAYAYSIQPKSKTSEVFKLAINTNEVHAIEIPGDKVVACFYKEIDSFSYDGKVYSRDTSKTFDAAKGQFQIFDKQ